MTNTIKLSAASKLARNGAVHSVEVTGLPGGWTIQIKTASVALTLASHDAAPRVFRTLDTAIKVIRERLGLRGRLMVDHDKWVPSDVHAKLYKTYLRDAVLEARRDPRPPISSAETKALMDTVKAGQSAKLAAVMARRALV